MYKIISNYIVFVMILGPNYFHVILNREKYFKKILSLGPLGIV